LNLPPISDEDHVVEILENLVADTNLPLITVVCDKRLFDDTKAYVIVGKTPYPLRNVEDEVSEEYAVGSGSVFNAMFMQYLVDGRQNDHNFAGSDWEITKRLAVEAGQYALKHWNRGFATDLFSPY
jgi:hypothetical protein